MIPTGSRAPAGAVHLADEHELDGTGDKDLPALEVLHDRYHGSRAWRWPRHASCPRDRTPAAAQPGRLASGSSW